MCAGISPVYSRCVSTLNPLNFISMYWFLLVAAPTSSPGSFQVWSPGTRLSLIGAWGQIGPATLYIDFNRVAKWWRHKNNFSEIMDFVQLFWTTYMRKVHIPRNWFFSAPNSWDMGFWSSNCSILNPLFRVGSFHLEPEQNKRVSYGTIWNFKWLYLYFFQYN